MQIVNDLSNKEYHSHDSISSSGLKLIAKSPKHFWSQHINPERTKSEPTDEMKLGTLCHTMVFEPEKFEDEFGIMPAGIKKNTKEGRQLYSEYEKKYLGKTIVSEEDLDIAKTVSNEVNSHPRLSLVKNKKGIAEQSIFFTYKGVNFRIRPDYSILPSLKFQNGIIFDLKTTKEADYAGFSRQAYNLGYWIQAALYCIGYQIAYNTQDLPEFIFIAAEKSDPFIVEVYRAEKEDLELAIKQVDKLIEIYKDCKESGNWFGSDGTIKQLKMPNWAKEKK